MYTGNFDLTINQLTTNYIIDLGRICPSWYSRPLCKQRTELWIVILTGIMDRSLLINFFPQLLIWAQLIYETLLICKRYYICYFNIIMIIILLV